MGTDNGAEKAVPGPEDVAPSPSLPSTADTASPPGALHPEPVRGEPQFTEGILDDGSTIGIAAFRALYARDLGRSSFPDVVCRSCAQRLVAVLPAEGQSFFRHFRRIPECWASAPEGELHLKAKAHLHGLLEEVRDGEGTLRCQSACAECGSVQRFDVARLTRHHSVLVEHWGDPRKQFKPDVSITRDGPVAWLEVLVHSAMSEKKKRHVVAAGLPTVEIRAEDVLALGGLLESPLPLPVQVHGLEVPPCADCAELKRRAAELAAADARREAEVSVALEAWAARHPYFRRDLASVVVAFFEPGIQKSSCLVRYVFEGHWGDAGLMRISLSESDRQPRGPPGWNFGADEGSVVTTSMTGTNDVPPRAEFLDWAARKLTAHIERSPWRAMQRLPLGNLRAFAVWPELTSLWRREVKGDWYLAVPWKEAYRITEPPRSHRRRKRPPPRRPLPVLEEGWVPARAVLGSAMARRPEGWGPDLFVSPETLAAERVLAKSRARNAMNATRRSHLLSPEDIQSSVFKYEE